MHQPLQTTWTIKELLEAQPQATRVIFDFKLGCVGCAFQKFCTIQEVSEIYSIDLQTLLKALDNHV